jgi:Sulfatase-modifying factor enzyme 1
VDAVQARQKGTNLAAVALQPALRALEANPMLLTAMALIHQQDTRHPEELLFNNIRNGARELFYLAAELLEDELPTQQMQRAALWSGQMALMASGEWIKRGARTPQRVQAYFRRLVPHMVTLLTSDLTAPERCQAGEVLGQFGNPRFQAEAWYSPDEPLLGFVEIPVGPFLFGSDPACDPGAFDDEQPQHEISSPRYFIGRYPVTMAQFLAFVRDGSYQPQIENSLHGQTSHQVVDVMHRSGRHAGQSRQYRLLSKSQGLGLWLIRVGGRDSFRCQAVILSNRSQSRPSGPCVAADPSRIWPRTQSG